MDAFEELSGIDPAVSDCLTAWRAELAGLNPKSYEYRELAALVGGLATEAGLTFALSDQEGMAESGLDDLPVPAGLCEGYGVTRLRSTREPIQTDTALMKERHICR